VQLFGKFRVSREGAEVPGLESLRVRELLSYLLVNRERSFLRATLAEFLWGEDSAVGQAQKHMRQAIWQLHASLDADASAPERRVVLVEGDRIQVSPLSAVTSDVGVFESVARSYRDVPGAALDAVAVQALHSAVELYKGDLLEGCVHDWCLYERERLQSLYLVMLDKLMGWCETRGVFETGAAYGALVLQIDRAHERTHQRLMRSLKAGRFQFTLGNDPDMIPSLINYVQSIVSSM